MAKHALRIEAFGTVDEANSVIGLARVHADGDCDAMLARVQNDLFDLGADLAVPEEGRRGAGALRITPAQVARLESEIDTMNAGLEPLTSFILPGGSDVSAWLHLARTVVRRAERLITALSLEETVNPAVLEYTNRLSDHLFVMARHLNDNGRADHLWAPGATREG